MVCKINSTLVACKRVRPNLLLINSTLNHISGNINSLTVTFVHYFYNEKYDIEEVHFSIFISSSTKDSIQYGSHEHLSRPLLTSDLSPP